MAAEYNLYVICTHINRTILHN